MLRCCCHNHFELSSLYLDSLVNIVKTDKLLAPPSKEARSGYAGLLNAAQIKLNFSCLQAAIGRATYRTVFVLVQLWILPSNFISCIIFSLVE